MPATVSHAFSNTVADGTNTGIVRPSDWNSSHLISFSAVEGLSLSGNTAGVLALISTGTAILAGGNNITLSQNGQSITISAANETLTVPPIGTAVKAVQTAGSTGTITRFAPEDHAHAGVPTVSAIGNTAGNTTQGNLSLILAGGNNVTLSGSTVAGAMTLTISAANETLTVPPIGTAVKAVQTSGSTGTITRFAPEDHAHQGVAGIDANGTASTYYGTVQLSAGALMSLASGGNTSRGSIQIINLLSTATTVSSVATANAIGANASRFALEAHQHGGVPTVSVVGNTAGNTTQGNMSLVLAGGPNVTLSGGTAAGVMTVSISAPAAGGTVSSATTVSSVATANAIGADAGRYALEGHQHGGIPTVSVVGNTAGNTTQGNMSLVLAGGPNITLSGGTAAGVMTVSVSAANAGAAQTLTRFCNLAPGVSAAPLAAVGTNNGTMIVFPLTPMADMFEGAITVSTVLVNMSGNVIGSSAHSITMSLGFYTIANSTALSLLYLASSTYAQASGSSASTAYNGPRFWSFHSSQFSNSASNATTPSFSEGGIYCGAIVMKSSSQAKAISLLGQYFNGTAQRSGTMGTSLVTATSLQAFPFMGVYSSGSLPATITRSSINGANASAGFIPCIIFENQVSAF